MLFTDEGYKYISKLVVQFSGLFILAISNFDSVFVPFVPALAAMFIKTNKL